MHGLSEAEFQTVRAILDLPASTERERIEFSGLPSSTYTTARRRMFQEGWLRDLMIPTPGAWGLEGIELRIVRPTLTDRRAVVEEWSDDPQCVLLWEGVHSIFGVFFEGPVRSSPPTSSSTPIFPGGFSVRPRRSHGSVPVYFDYSGLWGNFGGKGPPAMYPAALDLAHPPAARGVIEAAGEFVQGNGESTPGPNRWLATERTSRRHREALDQHVISPRTIIDPGKVPPYDDRRLGEVIIVHGVLRGSQTAAQLLGSLTGQCGVYPFLLAEAEGQLLLAGLGQTRAEGPGRIPAVSARGPVSSVLREFLDPAELVLEPAESIVAPIDHRYPRGPTEPIPPRR